jgi:hypothetical protein
MTFLTEASASRYFRVRRLVAGAGIDRARLARSKASAIKAACEIVGALALIATTMTALAFFELWVWVPHLPR